MDHGTDWRGDDTSPEEPRPGLLVGSELNVWRRGQTHASTPPGAARRVVPAARSP
jgi:hypothetical protein